MRLPRMIECQCLAAASNGCCRIARELGLCALKDQMEARRLTWATAIEVARDLRQHDMAKALTDAAQRYDGFEPDELVECYPSAPKAPPAGESFWCPVCQTEFTAKVEEWLTSEVDCVHCGRHLSVYWSDNYDEESGGSWSSVQLVPVPEEDEP